MNLFLLVQKYLRDRPRISRSGLIAQGEIYYFFLKLCTS